MDYNPSKNYQKKTLGYTCKTTVDEGEDVSPQQTACPVSSSVHWSQLSWTSDVGDCIASVTKKGLYIKGQVPVGIFMDLVFTSSHAPVPTFIN